MSNLSKETIAEWFKGLQDNICKSLEECDGKAKFQEDLWTRPEGGGGRTRVIQKGNVFEKGGVNFSAVEGKLPEKIKEALKLPDAYFFASGVSIVIHPNSPEVPIIHMNVRYFEIAKDPEFKENITYWFGGGIDLTPHYINKDQSSFFHNQLKSACDSTDESYYDEFKKWADDYFFIKHRKETRGVGGIFFDRLNEESRGLSKEAIFELVKNVGNTFAPTYVKIVNENKSLSYGEEEKRWQKIRRSRYVEFNLVYDKGTKFGLDTDGRIESILMSLPLETGWEYNPQFEAGSREQETLDLLVKGIDWV
jgi:coproporphyrinogen III oxidase